MKTNTHKNLFSLLVIAAVVMLWFSPWWAGGKVLAPLDLLNGAMSPWWQKNQISNYPKNHFVSDGVDQYLVYRMIAAESYRREGWVGWSSLTYGGTAQYANTMALYADWTMQLHRWFDFWTAWHLGLIGQVMIAAYGMWQFLKGRGISDLWAVCGALLFALNSQFVTWAYHRWALSSFCWVPWILWSIDRHATGSRRHGAIVPIYLALAYLGGTLQHGALVSLIVIARWLEDLWQGCMQHARAKEHLCMTGRYALWGFIGLTLSAFMWVPCVDAFLISERVGLHIGLHGYEPGFYPGGFLQPLMNLCAYPLQAFPSLLGRCDSLDVMKLFKSDLFYISFFGTLPVLISLRGIWRKETPLLARILILLGLILPLTPLVRLLYQRLLLLFIIGGITAFANFMVYSSLEERRVLMRKLAISAAVVLCCWTLVSIALRLSPWLLEMLQTKVTAVASGGSFHYFSDWKDVRIARFVAGLFVWNSQQLVPVTLLVIAIIALWWSSSNPPFKRKIGSVALAMVCVIEVTWFATRWLVWSDSTKQPLFAETAETKSLKQIVGAHGRTTTLIHPTAHMALTPFIPNTLSAYGIASIHGYDSIIPDGMLRPFESAGDARKLGRLAVTHLVTWHGNPNVTADWKPVWSSSTMDLYQNTLAMPRYAGFSSDCEMHNFFNDKEKTVTCATLHESTGKENQRIIGIPAGVRWMRIADNHATGWEYRSSSDGRWQKVLRAPDSSMLLENPNPGSGAELEMRYAPATRRWGIVISSLGLLLTFLGSFLPVTRPAFNPL